MKGLLKSNSLRKTGALALMTKHKYTTAAGGALLGAQMIHGAKQRNANNSSRGRVTAVSSGSLGQFMARSSGGSTF
jgi:hypothetical protein